jgi:hypothetical protein
VPPRPERCSHRASARPAIQQRLHRAFGLSPHDADGRYLDIEEGAAYRVSHGGTHVERVE